MTDSCDQEAKQELSFGQRLFQYVFVMLLNLLVTYFFLRVAWDIFASSYTSMGAEWTFCIFSVSIIYFIAAYVANPPNATSSPMPDKSFTPKARPICRNLFSVLLYFLPPVLAVVLALYFDNSRLSLQIAPIYVLLLIPFFSHMLHISRLVLKSIQRKLRSGSILPPAGMCACCKNDKSSQDKMSLTQNISPTALSLFYAALWTWLLNYYCYKHHSLLNKSVWEMVTVWVIVLVSWLRAGTWIVSIIISIFDKLKSRQIPNC